MQPFLKIVGNGQRTARDLTGEEAETVIEMVLDGRATTAQTAALIAALRIKEESADELAAFARVLRRHSERIELNHPRLVDICLPYDGRSKAPSLVPAAALIATAAGAKIALHGRPGPTTAPKFGVGVGDVLAALGVAIDLPLAAAAKLIEDDSVGVAFVSSAQFSPTLEKFNAIRIEYGMRSFFNTIEKLINPLGAPSAITGVFHGPVLSRVAAAMQAQHYKRGIAVQGPEGSIDVLTSRRTNLIEFTSLEAIPTESIIDPTKFGWWERTETETPAEPVTAASNAQLTRLLLQPDNLALRPLQRGALLTAALMIYVADKAGSVEAAIVAAQQALASGSAELRLTRLCSVSQAVRTPAD